LFESEAAIHFVASRLTSNSGGDELLFEGAARGWQGERNLAAERIAIDQRRETLEATGQVSSRIPREAAGRTLSEADYVQISADTLTYGEATRRAVYSGSVTARLVEGWLEARRLEVELGADSRKLESARASESVRLEFLRSAKGELAAPFSGTADRAEYEPGAATLRLFGDSAPAVVRRLGPDAGTTKGRVLRYRLDEGVLEVDADDQKPALIRTSPG
jgi:lipopolysaccharide transport protein LptA